MPPNIRLSGNLPIPTQDTLFESVALVRQLPAARNALLAIFAIMLPVILMFCGLSVDVGMLELKKLQMQTAADAAALGAELEWERSTGNQYAQGMADAAVNGFTNGVDGVTITIGNPYWSGDFSGRYDTQYVTISQPVKSLFIGAFTGGTTTVKVSATVMSPPCGYYTQTAGIANPHALKITNSLAIINQGVFSRCPVYVNKGISLSSNMTMYNNAALSTGAAGDSSFNGTFGPTPTYAFPAVTDPLASLVQPTVSACNHTNFSVSTSAWTTLNPGVYCGSNSTPGITLTGANVYFNPGLYVITGGLHSTATTLGGSGLTMFFTKVSGTTHYGQIIFDGNSRINISAPSVPSGGSLATILFFTDRSWVHTSAQDFQLNDGEYYGSGVWYVTGTGIQLTAASSTYSPGYIALVTDSVYVDSSTLNLFSDFSMVTTGNPFRTQAVLVQ